MTDPQILDNAVLPFITDPAKRLYFEKMLSTKLQLTAMQKQLKPNFWIPTPLFQSLRNSFIAHTKNLSGMTYVYAAPKRTGKTTAGVAAIDLAMQANVEPYSCLYVDAGSFLRQNFRKALGAPDLMDDEDVIACLAASLKPKRDGLPPDPFTYSNTLSQVPPVFVIDNVRAFLKEDNDFLEIFYKACYSSRILVYIFTDVEEIANMICGMNGKARIKPLLENWSDEGEEKWTIVKDETAPTGWVAKGIEWKAQHWTRKKLSKIVKDRFPGHDWGNSETEEDKDILTFCHDGDLPDDVMNHAEAIITESSGEDFKSALGVLEDPSQNDNIG